jgi:hypothetical protein
MYKLVLSLNCGRGPWLCENTTRYKYTGNFEVCGHAQCQANAKFTFCSALRPNQISFSHDQDPERSLAGSKSRSAASPYLILANPLCCHRG